MTHAAYHAPSHGHSVLIVDDDARVRRALTRLLIWAGWQVVGEAADEQGALQRAERTHPELVLLDLWLPHSSFGLLRQLQHVTPPPRVLILTVETDPTFRQQAYALGACGYVPKTTSPMDLVALLRQLFEGDALPSI
jgi:DNA-binding NarL/FixJ family response regulator